MATYIFLGPDLSGKTTAITRLGFDLKDAVLTKNLRIEGDFETLNKCMADLVSVENSPNSLRLWDRWQLFDEIVYYKVKHDRPSALEAFLPLISKKMSKLPILIMWFDCSEEIIKQRYEQRGDEYLSLEQIYEAKKVYRDFMARLACDTYKVNTDCPKEEVVAKVKRVMGSYEQVIKKMEE